MKSFGKSCSIAYDSDVVVSSTSCHWGKVKVGAHFKLNDDQISYKIVSAEEKSHIFDYEVKNRNTLTIKRNCFPYIFDEDELEISYKEYELDSAPLIVGPGLGYKVDDILYVEGGHASEDFHQIASLKVSEVDEEGRIIAVQIENKGKYTNPPPELNKLESNGFGHKAQIHLKFVELSARKWTDRFVSLVNYVENESILTLRYPLPAGIQRGKLSVKKWQLTLDSKYKEVPFNQKNKKYTILNDLSPNYGIPLLTRGHASPEVIINNLTLKITDLLANHEKEETEQDALIESLVKRIEKLESDKQPDYYKG